MPVSYSKIKDAEFKLGVEEEQNSGVDHASHSVQGKRLLRLFLQVLYFSPQPFSERR